MTFIKAALAFLGSELGIYAMIAAAGLFLVGTQWNWQSLVTVPRIERERDDARAKLAIREGEWKDERVRSANAHAAEVQRIRDEGVALQKRADRAQENGDAKIERLERVVARSGSTEQRMRDRIRALESAASRPAGAASTADSGPTPAVAAGMLADLCRESDRRAGIYALYADRLRIAAESCLEAWPVNGAASAASGAAP